MSSGRPASSRGTLRSLTPTATSRTSSISGPPVASPTAATTSMGAWGQGKLKIGGSSVPISGPGVGSAVAASVQNGMSGAGSGSANGEGKDGDVHPLKHDWTFYYVHRPPGAKVIEYEKEIKTVASFGSTESFWTIYAHVLPPSSLPAVTDLLMFASHVRRPVWEELPNGGKWVVRLRKGVADRLWESSLLALLGDQFDEEDGVVGVVLSIRSQEDILSVWSDRERAGAGAAVEEGEKRDGVRDKLIHFLGLPPNTAFEYKSNRALLENAHTPSNHDRHIERGHNSHHHNSHRGERGDRNDRGERGERGGENGHAQGYHHSRTEGRERGDHHGRSGNAGVERHSERRGGPGQGGFSREDSGVGAGGGSPWSRR